MAEPRDESDAAVTDRAGWRMMGIGWEFLSQVVAGLILGWVVDWAFSTTPWGILGGLAAGLLVGMWTFIRSALKLNASLPAVRKPREGWKTIPESKDDDDDVQQGAPDDGRRR